LNTPCSYEPVFKLKYIRKNETDIKRKIRCITQVCEFSGEISTYFGLPAHFRAGKYIKLLSFLSENVNIIKR